MVLNTHGCFVGVAEGYEKGSKVGKAFGCMEDFNEDEAMMGKPTVAAMA